MLYHHQNPIIKPPQKLDFDRLLPGGFTVLDFAMFQISSLRNPKTLVNGNPKKSNSLTSKQETCF